MYISKTRFSNKNILFWIAIFHLLSSHITKKRNWRANNSGNLLTLYRLNNSITHWLPQRCPQDISSFGSKSTEPLVFYKSKDLSHLQIILFADGKISTQNFREFVRVENIRQDFILDLIAVFGTQSWRQIVGCEREQSWYSELSIHSSLDSNFCVEFPDVYSLIYKFFAQVKLSTSLACSWLFSAAFYFLTNILNRPLPGLRRKGRILKTFFLLILAEFLKILVLFLSIRLVAAVAVYRCVLLLLLCCWYWGNSAWCFFCCWSCCLLPLILLALCCC